MRLLTRFYLLSSFICLSCTHGNRPSDTEQINERIINHQIQYLPEIYYGDPDIFELAVELLKIDSLSDRDSYIIWIDNTKITFQGLRNNSVKQISSSLINLSDSILKYGNNCNASKAEKSYLIYGWILFEFLNNEREGVISVKNKKLQTLKSKEYYEFIGFWSNFSKLIEYKIDENTGSSGSYDVPVRLTNLINEFNQVSENKESDLPHHDIDVDKIENKKQLLITEISGIRTTYFDEEREKYKENEFIENLKKRTIVSLQDLISIRNETATLYQNKSLYLSDTLSYLDVLIKGIIAL